MQGVLEVGGLPKPGRSAADANTYLLHHQTYLNPVLCRVSVSAGNRPSTSILLPELNAYTVGQVLALYEHQVAVQVRHNSLA